MRKKSSFLAPGAMAASALLTAWGPSFAADLPILAPAQCQLHQLAQSVRAGWLARGHSAQELAAVAAPTLTGGSVTNSTITIGVAGEFPSMQFSYTTGTPGLYFIEYAFTSPSGTQLYTNSYPEAGYSQGGTLNFASVVAMGLYSAPGKWTLSSVTLMDNAGNSTTYTQPQLSALIGKQDYFTVVNTGPADSTAPRISGGTIVNDTVSLSARLPILAAKIAASKPKGPGIYEGYVLIQPPGQTYSYYSVLPYPLPVTRGQIRANNIFGSFSSTGTWKIVGYGVCDFAFTCTTGSTDAAVLAVFGTDSFTLTP